MAFAWDLFAEELGNVAERLAGGIIQRDAEKRGEKRQLRMAKELQDISLEGLNKQLEIQEPFKKDADARLLERQKELAEFGMGLQKEMEEWRGELNRGLTLFAGSEGYTKAIEKARKEGGLSQIAIMKMEDSIMKARAGEPVDISDFEGLDPFSRMTVMDLLKQNNERTRNFQLKTDQVAKEMLQLTNLIEYRKRQERVAGEREERLGVSALEVSAGRWAAERTRLDTAVEKARTSVEKAETVFSDYRSELLGELEDAGKINAKGEAFATIGGKKKVKLIDPDTGEVNEKAREEFVKSYSRYRGRFKRLDELRENVKARQKDVETRNKRRDEFHGGAPEGEVVSKTWTGSDGKTYEIGKTYTIGGQKVRCIGENQFEPVK